MATDNDKKRIRFFVELMISGQKKSHKRGLETTLFMGFD